MKLIAQQLDATLKLQARENSVRTRMAVLDAEINNLLTAGRRDYLLTASPPMYSTEYFSQFRSKRQVRLTIPVGVAYGSDVPQVMDILMTCAKDHEMIVKSSPPQVLFLRFGESSLDFELRAWVADADYRMQVRSDLHQEIDRRFREANIEIAFPQRDLHLRSIDGAIMEPFVKTF